VGTSKYISLRLKSAQILRNSSFTETFVLAGTVSLVPSGLMTFSGLEMSRASGRPRHWRAMRMRYVVQLTLPPLDSAS
jgi:hypothetical protein